MNYRGRHVIVTGGTGALGAAVVAALLEAGATCHLSYMLDTEAERFAHRNDPRVTLARIHDLADEASVAALYATVPDLWASIHLAGGFASGPVAETPKADVLKQIETNFITAFLCCGAAVRAMTRTGRGGRIVNVAARPALEWRAGAGMAAYAASKAAVAAMTAALAGEVAQAGILVNAVVPSIMDTPGNRAAMPKANHANWPKTVEVAATILFLASEQNAVTSGAAIPVYGKS